MKGNKLSSQPTIRRLPSYLVVVHQANDEGQEYISGTVIAQELELEPIQVRKDLAITGIIGKPRIGYPVKELITAINHFLHWDASRNSAIVGAGHLGQALMGNKEFMKHGLDIVAAFDVDPDKIGTRIHGVNVFALDKIEAKLKELKIEIAVLTVPPQYAQGGDGFHRSGGNQGYLEFHQREAQGAGADRGPAGRPFLGLRRPFGKDGPRPGRSPVKVLKLIFKLPLLL